MWNSSTGTRSSAAVHHEFEAKSKVDVNFDELLTVFMMELSSLTLNLAEFESFDPSKLIRKQVDRRKMILIIILSKSTR